MDKLNEYKEWYYKEIEHSERLNSKIAGHLTLLTVLGAGVIFIWTNIKPYCNDCIFVSAAIITTCCFLLSCVFFVISYKGVKYDYLDISAMHGLLVKIDIIDRQFPNLSTDCEVKRQELLEKNYADFAINNRKYNIKKSRDQHRTMVMLIIAFLTLFITVAYYFIRYYLTETT